MKPERIKKAQISGNHEYLSAAGKKGAEVSNKKRRLRAEHEAIWEEVAAEEEILESNQRAREANEHIVPIDSSELEEDVDK